MGKEIERKFLPANDLWRGLAPGELYRQGYLSTGRGSTVRVRIVGDRGILTVKGPGLGQEKLEFEYDIPIGEARQMLDSLCLKPLIEKIRHKIPYRGFVWEVDDFLGENQGLVVCEIELAHVDQEFDKPVWVGEEVTADSRYYNANLVRHPFSRWKDGTGSVG